MIDYVSFQTFNDRGFLVDFLYYLTCNTKYLNPAIYSLEQITSVAGPYTHKGTMMKRLALLLLFVLFSLNFNKKGINLKKNSSMYTVQITFF